MGDLNINTIGDFNMSTKEKEAREELNINGEVVEFDGNPVYVSKPKHPEPEEYEVLTRHILQNTRERIVGEFAGEYFVQRYKYWRGGKIYCVPSNPSEPPKWGAAVCTGSREEIISTEEGPANKDLLISLSRENLWVRKLYFFCLSVSRGRSRLKEKYITYPIDKFRRVKRAIRTDDVLLSQEEIAELKEEDY